jgi:HAD superfamily hydrolase (TIGR01459 family)
MSCLASERENGAVRLYGGMAEVAERYDGYILDLWGVLHDGEQAFPWAVDCLSELRVREKRVLILSNAPRRTDAIAARCAELGIVSEHYDALMSSGEDAWRHLKERPDTWYQALGERCYHLGPARDLGMREGLAYTFVDQLEDADFILLTGALSTDDSADTYTPFLEAALRRRLPMVCANPDLVVYRGQRMEICAGTIAARYEELGGEVRYHGKPHAKIYDTCLGLFGGMAPERIVAVGDSLRTDVLGAHAVGLDALFIVSGIHKGELAGESGDAVDLAKLDALYEKRAARPRGALLKFSW